MSALAKVFVVLNLLLSLLFFGTSATLFLTRQDLVAEKFRAEQQFENDRERLQQKIQQLHGALNLQHEALTTTRARESELSNDLKQIQNEVQTQTQRANDAEDRLLQAQKLTEAARNQLAEKEKRITALEQQIAQAKEARDEALDQAEQANEQRNIARRDLQNTTKELQSTREQVVTLEQEAERLGLQLASVRKALPDVPIPSSPPVPLDARVVAVDPALRAVVISVGKDQEVKVGDEFTVHRGGDLVGKVQVTRLYRDLAGARVIYEADGQSITVGDNATTKINTLSS